jgi:hypothetical protein
VKQIQINHIQQMGLGIQYHPQNQDKQIVVVVQVVVVTLPDHMVHPPAVHSTKRAKAGLELLLLGFNFVIKGENL